MHFSRCNCISVWRLLVPLIAERLDACSCRMQVRTLHRRTYVNSQRRGLHDSNQSKREQEREGRRDRQREIEERFCNNPSIIFLLNHYHHRNRNCNRNALFISVLGTVQFLFDRPVVCVSLRSLLSILCGASSNHPRSDE